MPDNSKTDLTENLSKTDTGSPSRPSESSKVLNKVRRNIIGIWKPLTLGSEQYKPERTVDSIDKYIKENPLERLLYSEISTFIVGLDEEARATVSTNLETLISYVLDNEVSDNIRKICIKLYDHFQLNLIQIENAKAASDRAIAQSIVDEKDKLREEVKGIQKEHITILGIFAAIMLAFVGGFTFSTSVLQNLGKVSTGELIIVALVIGLVFILLITILLNFLREINGKSKKDKSSAKSTCAIIIVSILLALFLIGYALSRTDIGTIKRFFGAPDSNVTVTAEPETTEMMPVSSEG